jgi:hypothetical protein
MFERCFYGRCADRVTHLIPFPDVPSGGLVDTVGFSYCWLSAKRYVD